MWFVFSLSFYRILIAVIILANLIGFLYLFIMIYFSIIGYDCGVENKIREAFKIAIEMYKENIRIQLETFILIGLAICILQLTLNY